MKYRRKKQLTIILVLVAVVSSVSIGFAAFSATLNISSSATVTPNSDNFSVVFSSSQYAITTNNTSGTVVNGVGTKGAIGGITNLYQNSASGLVAEFTEPGQSLNITIYAHNTGEYDAYLTGINISNINGNSYKKCIASSGTTDSLVQSACNGISISINIGGIDYAYGTPITNHSLSKGSVEPIIITVAYDSTAARADGNFDISFGDISLEYTTIDNKQISFTLQSKTYQVIDGTTWRTFLNSSENKSDFSITDDTIQNYFRHGIKYTHASGATITVNPDDKILDGVTYQEAGGGNYATDPT